jgi:hypothetical protein
MLALRWPQLVALICLKIALERKARSGVSARSVPPASRINGLKSANKVVKGRISCSYYPRALPPASSNLIKNGIVKKQH